jgi:hypothetical protein
MRDNIAVLASRDSRKQQTALVRVLDTQTEIRTGNYLNRRQKPYLLSQLFLWGRTEKDDICDVWYNTINKKHNKN